MRKYRITFLLMLFGSVLYAQNPVKIYGNLGLENVNISVLNTQYGTSTDAKGDYSLTLFVKDKPVDLLYSCIGYCDTVLSFSRKALQQDSLRVSFRLREKKYDLPEAGIVANRDFYRTERGRRIADIAFADDRILVLENRKDKSNLMVLNAEGETVSQAQYDSLYTKIHIDCFGDYILVGENFCQQIYLDSDDKPQKVSVFEIRVFNEKLLSCVAKYNGAFIFEDRNANVPKSFVRKDHNKVKRYYYVEQNDPSHQKKLLAEFADAEAIRNCQAVFNEIIRLYNEKMRNKPENENVLLIGVWDGNLLGLLPFDENHEASNPDDKLLMALISDYMNLEATPLNLNVIIDSDKMYFVDFDRLEITELSEDFKIGKKLPLSVSDQTWFKKLCLKDEKTGKHYGVYSKDGICFVGVLDFEKASVSMTNKASNSIYPDVFKINGGYAYSVHFDKERQIGIMNRVKLN